MLISLFVNRESLSSNTNYGEDGKIGKVVNNEEVKTMMQMCSFSILAVSLPSPSEWGNSCNRIINLDLWFWINFQVQRK